MAAATTTSPADTGLENVEKKEAVLPTPDLEVAGVNPAQDPLALLEKIRTSDDAHPTRVSVLIAKGCRYSE